LKTTNSNKQGGIKLDLVFHKLYEKYHQDVFQFLFYIVRNRKHAEDLMEEVYFRLLKSYRKIEGISSEKARLFSIARDVAIEDFREQVGWKERFMERLNWTTKQV
jgi:RNA polymerase sigma-70 factor, ECF subfamily